MSTHNISFCGEIRDPYQYFWIELKHQELWYRTLTRCCLHQCLIWDCTFGCINNKNCTFHPLQSHHITKTCLYNFDPFKPHFYTLKLGFKGVYIILIISAQTFCEYSLEPPRRGGSNECPQFVLSRHLKTRRIFHLKVFIFGGQFSIYLNRRVFVMIIHFTSS